MVPQIVRKLHLKKLSFLDLFHILCNIYIVCVSFKICIYCIIAQHDLIKSQLKIKTISGVRLNIYNYKGE